MQRERFTRAWEAISNSVAHGSSDHFQIGQLGRLRHRQADAPESHNWQRDGGIQDCPTVHFILSLGLGGLDPPEGGAPLTAMGQQKFLQRLDSQLKISKAPRGLLVTTSNKQLQIENWGHFILSSQPWRGFWTKCFSNSSLEVKANGFSTPSQYTHTHTYTCTHTCAHARTHACAHTHVFTYTQDTY